MMGRMILCVIVLLASVFHIEIGARPQVSASSIATFITVAYPNGTRILAELADTEEKRARGLMFREQLASDRGMLFVFSEPGQWVFWMKNTKIPLDILWLDSKKKIVDLVENMPRCLGEPCLQYQPAYEASYALEVPAGSIKRLRLAKGMQLSFDLQKQVEK
jgi:uncharacterized membrane protein (UPF0127 family)